MRTVRSQALKPHIESTRDERIEYSEEKAAYRKRLWGIVGAIWLEVIVLAFVVVQVSRLQTPIAGWMDRLIDLLVRR
jgi:hypothetical protein